MTWNPWRQFCAWRASEARYYAALIGLAVYMLSTPNAQSEARSLHERLDRRARR